MEIIEQLNGVTFNWKKDGTASGGVIAQDVQKVMPYAVGQSKGGENGSTLSVNYDALFAPVIEAIKELKALFDGLSAKVAALFTRVDSHDIELKALREELKQLHGEFTSYKAAHP